MNLETENDSRPARDLYPGDNRTPGSPLDIALAQVAHLDLNLNPLGSTEWAQKILRQDIERIARTLASATAAGLKETIAAQNAAIERLQARVETGGKLAAILTQINGEFGGCECGLEGCADCGRWGQVRVALGEWEEGRKG